ncbi:MAG: cell division protein FtsQ/DivIB [Dysgonamonadaceae bacterium]|jgi:cell division protein FtsQ|nr:cell division protein FtsQ/DivIB [Dysgonamonadaceae bacterium]
MVKRIILISLAALLAAYLVFAVVCLNRKAKEPTVCNQLVVELVDAPENRAIGETGVIQVLQKAHLNPVGKDLSQVSTANIEQTLETNRFVKQAKCYKSINGDVHVTIRQRTPVLRIITANANYYIDDEGKSMPVPENYSAYVPVATGAIKETFAQKELYELILFLQKDKYWNDKVEQIYVDANQEIELTPRIGNHQILLGKSENYSEKLSKLKLFYNKGLDKVGWNKYSQINVKYKNQVVCTRKE